MHKKDIQHVEVAREPGGEPRWAPMLEEILAARRQPVLRRWREMILGAYAASGARILRDEPDPFANPVGAAIRDATTSLLEQLLRPGNTDAAQSLERLVRLRAVAGIGAGQAVGFVLQLKHVLREELADQLGTVGAHEELRALGERIDGFALLAFDLYVSCRERLFEIKAEEARRGRGVLERRLAREGREERDPALPSRPVPSEG